MTDHKNAQRLQEENNDNGVQSRVWDGYFVEGRDTIMGSYHKCDICKRIPSEIYYDSSRLIPIRYCKKCRVEDFKPKNLWQRFWFWIDQKLAAKP